MTAGTIGAFVTIEGADGVHVLSNNHVLAASGRGEVGDAVLQPGPADGGGPDDRIGHLAAAVELDPSEPNLVDAAVAKVDDDVEVDAAAHDGAVTEVIAPDEVRGRVRKIGRTTGVTRGQISAFEVDGLPVGYDTGVFTFDDQIEIEGVLGLFSDGGDSGSLITTEGDPLGVGLLFAGSTTGGPGGTGVTYANPLGAVLEALTATLDGGPHRPVVSDPLARARAVKEQLRDALCRRSARPRRRPGRRDDGFAVRVLVADLAAATELGLPRRGRRRARRGEPRRRDSRPGLRGRSVGGTGACDDGGDSAGAGSAVECRLARGKSLASARLPGAGSFRGKCGGLRRRWSLASARLPGAGSFRGKCGGLRRRWSLASARLPGAGSFGNAAGYDGGGRWLRLGCRARARSGEVRRATTEVVVGFGSVAGAGSFGKCGGLRRR